MSNDNDFMRGLRAGIELGRLQGFGFGVFAAIMVAGILIVAGVFRGF